MRRGITGSYSDGNLVYLDLARSGRCLPDGDGPGLERETPDPEAARRDGLGWARSWNETPGAGARPLALPLMDLRLDKADLLARLGIGEEEADRFHFAAPFDQETSETLRRGDTPRTVPAARHATERCDTSPAATDLLPVGMTIGPFSLATKLMADPITAVALLGSGRLSRGRCAGEAALSTVWRRPDGRARLGAAATRTGRGP